MLGAKAATGTETGANVALTARERPTDMPGCEGGRYRKAVVLQTSPPAVQDGGFRTGEFLPTRAVDDDRRGKFDIQLTVPLPG